MNKERLDVFESLVYLGVHAFFLALATVLVFTLDAGTVALGAFIVGYLLAILASSATRIKNIWTYFRQR